MEEQKRNPVEDFDRREIVYYLRQIYRLLIFWSVILLLIFLLRSCFPPTVKVKVEDASKVGVMNLQNLLRRNVDIVTERGLHWYIKEQVLHEARPI
jgi:hypothetical protein